jgi:hypothetical protein
VRLPLLVTLLGGALLLGLTLNRPEPLPSPYCRAGDPLAGVYHPSRLKVKSRCKLAAGVVQKVKFEEYDGDVHIDLRLDEAYRRLLSDGNDQIGGNLVVEVIPQDRAHVAIPEPNEHVTVIGPWVDDTAHDWREIHPAWWISGGTIRPASSDELHRTKLLLSGAAGRGEGD